jgi:DNA-binding NarL/FixJ family response regulator
MILTGTRHQESHRRHRSGVEEPARPGAEATALSPVVITLSPRLASRADDLTEAFGAGYQVTIAPDDCAVVAVMPSEPYAAIREYHRRHPKTRIVVFEPAPAVEAATVAACIDAGADGFVTQPSLHVLAAHILAIIRRPAVEPAR